MEPIYGQRTTCLLLSPPPGRPASTRRQAQGRTRRLALEICEPRWPLAALPLSLPLFDSPPADPSPAAEVFTPDQTAEVDPASDSTQAPSAELGELESNPEADSTEAVREGDVSEAADWNSLGAGPEAMALSATLEESAGASLEETDSDQPFSLRSAQDQADEAAGPESASPRRLDGFSAIAPLSNAGSGLEAERREWTPATIVRYPLYDAARTKSGGEAACPAPATARSLTFLDVGRVAAPAATGLRSGAPAWTPLELAGTGVRSENLATDFATDFASPARIAQQPSGPAASRLQPALAGENRGQRMMLLASAGRRLRDRVDARSPPVSNQSPELPQVQPQGREATTESADDKGTPETRRAGTAVPRRFEWAHQPVADQRVSRSALEEIAVLMLLAAEWFARTHARSSPEPQALWNLCVLDSRQIAARDKFFERLSSP